MSDKILFHDNKGPIQEFSWSKYIINGEEHSKLGDKKTGKGKDICVINAEVKKWKNRKGHTLNISMFSQVLDKGIDTLIIGAGIHKAIKVPENIITELKNNGIKNVYVLNTTCALAKYNELFRDGIKAALLAHGTC